MITLLSNVAHVVRKIKFTSHVKLNSLGLEIKLLNNFLYFRKSI